MKHSFATSEVFFRFPPLINNQIINVQNVVVWGKKYQPLTLIWTDV